MKLSRAKPRIIYCTPILASYKLLVFSTVVYTLRNVTVTRGRLKLKFSKVLTSILVRKLSKLKVSNSSGSRTYILHSYVIYTTKRLHAQRNTQTFRSCSSSSFKMLSQSHEFSSILTGKKKNPCQKIVLAPDSRRGRWSRFQEQRTLLVWPPRFASCFKKMRNSKMKEKTQRKF